MASSRWKRFAFFERQTLHIKQEILEDLISIANSSSSLQSLDLAGHEGQESVSLAVSTAALPLHSKPTTKNVQTQYEQQALSDMWTSLTACTSPTKDSAVQLPNQSSPLSSRGVATTALDGLVLCFAASKQCPRVHCFDITIRCNPAPNVVSDTAEEMDGWRGYWAPLSSSPPHHPPSSVQRSTKGGSEGQNDVVVGLASCRLPRNTKEEHSPLHVACIGKSTSMCHQIVVWEDPQLYLSCRQPLVTPTITDPAATVFRTNHATPSTWNAPADGNACTVDIVPGLVAIGTTTGVVLIYTYGPRNGVHPWLRIPAPPVPGMVVVSVQLSSVHSVFVAYNRTSQENSVSTTSAGICCYDLPHHARDGGSQQNPQSPVAPTARHDLDGRYVGASSLVDSCPSQKDNFTLTVARPDGLYSYSQTERTGVAPVDGAKLAICVIPSQVPAEVTREVDNERIGSGYTLVASTDVKSGRDAVDIYDSTNKLVAFHLLLSPGHRTVHACGLTTSPTKYPNGEVKGGRSSAVVLTTGGSLVTFTEKLTEEKISLLVQKHLYAAAIVVAFADPSYEATKITELYQRFAEYLYRKGDFSGAIDQYMHTIGSLESSHVIFRYLDAPKIPLLVKYLECLRSRELATSVHCELLRTCYMKLNDVQSAEAIAVPASWSINDASLDAILSNISAKPKDALATICSLEAPQAAEFLVIHGALLARALPRETAGVVISLCTGSYAPKSASSNQTLSDATATTTAAALNLNQAGKNNDSTTNNMQCEPYSVHLFASAFVEHPKMLRLILAHCNRNKCHLTPSLRCTLLELTLAEWNQAKRSGDTEAEKLRHKEAIASLTDSHCRDLGDNNALVMVQLAGFEEGKLLLYERSQMTPMLLERYAKDGKEKSRRQMLALCQTDPEILADVLGHFVVIASEKMAITELSGNQITGDVSLDDEAEDILEDIQEALMLARRQKVLAPVRIARILAGEGTGQFSTDRLPKEVKKTVPLSVALDYVGNILEESRKETTRLAMEVEEYNQLCNSMENEVDSLLRISYAMPSAATEDSASSNNRLNIDRLHNTVRSEDTVRSVQSLTDQGREAFWREMTQTEDSFDTIARFFAKGTIG